LSGKGELIAAGGGTFGGGAKRLLTGKRAKEPRIKGARGN